MTTPEPTGYLELTKWIAGFGLNGDGEPRNVPLETWPAVVGSLALERLCGLAEAAAEADLLRLTPDQLKSLRASHLEASLLSLALERALLTIDHGLMEEGVGGIVLKGPALAHCFYRDPSWRAFGDIDVLVRTREWRRACSVLERLGFRRELPEPRHGFDERFGKAAVHRNEQGLRIDLHRRLVLGPFGMWLDTDALFARTVAFEVAGRGFRRLDDTAMLLHACMHASLGWWPPLLMPVRDVAQIAAHGDIDWNVLWEDAAKWRLGAVVAHAFGLVEGELGLPTPPEAARFTAIRAPRRERRVLAGYTSGRRERGGTEWSTLWALPGIRAKAILVRDLLFPGKEFLAARAPKGARPSYLHRWATPVRWLRGRAR